MFKFHKPKLQPIKDITDLYHKVLVDVDNGYIGVVNVGGHGRRDGLVGYREQ